MTRFGRIKRFWLVLVWIGTTLVVFSRAEFNTLPLPYSYKSLEPHLSREVLELHHDNYYRNYAATLNDMLRTIERLEGSSLEEVMLDSYRWNKPLYNHAAEVWNHHFYFKCMTSIHHPPSRSLLERITNDFGSFDRFEVDFRKAGNSAFGSGWAWLVYNSQSGKLFVMNTIGADNPMVQNENYWPILTMDVWEHAYYLDYQNRRKDYTKAFINSLVDWVFVEETLSRVEVEAVIAAERREQKRLEEELARLEREKLEAEEAAERARIERIKMEAEAEVARQEKIRLEIEAAAEAARLRDERKVADAEAKRQDKERLEAEALAEAARLEQAGGKPAETETVPDAALPGMGDEEEPQAAPTEEIDGEKEVSSEEAKEATASWWSLPARAFRSIFAKSKASTHEDEAEAAPTEDFHGEKEVSLEPEIQEEAKEAKKSWWSLPARASRSIFGKSKAGMRDQEKVVTTENAESTKPEEVAPENKAPSQAEDKEVVAESTNPFVRYPVRVGKFLLGILRFILRVLHLILKIIFM